MIGGQVFGNRGIYLAQCSTRYKLGLWNKLYVIFLIHVITKRWKLPNFTKSSLFNTIFAWRRNYDFKKSVDKNINTKPPCISEKVDSESTDMSCCPDRPDTMLQTVETADGMHIERWKWKWIQCKIALDERFRRWPNSGWSVLILLAHERVSSSRN